jgi:hypothetical protein
MVPITIGTTKYHKIDEHRSIKCCFILSKQQKKLQIQKTAPRVDSNPISVPLASIFCLLILLRVSCVVDETPE